MLAQAGSWREHWGESGLLSQRVGKEKGLEMQANPEKCGYFPPENWHLTKGCLGLLGEDITLSIFAAGSLAPTSFPGLLLQSNIHEN